MSCAHSVSGQKRGRESGDEDQSGQQQTRSPLARIRQEIAKFTQHIVDGDIEETQAFLSRGGEWLQAHLKNECGDTPLTLAVRHGNPEMVAMMLHSNCDPNGFNDEDDTPLVLAVELKQLEVVKHLMKPEFGCIPNFDDSRALFECITSKQFEVLELLLQAGVDINVTDEFDRTPLWVAAGLEMDSDASSRFVAALLANGAKVEGSYESRWDSPLCYAYDAGNWDSARLLLNTKARTSMCYGGKGLLNRHMREKIHRDGLSSFKAIVEHCVDEVQSEHVLGAIESLGLGQSFPRGVALVVLEYLKYLW